MVIISFKVYLKVFWWKTLIIFPFSLICGKKSAPKRKPVDVQSSRADHADNVEPVFLKNALQQRYSISKSLFSFQLL